MRIISVLLLIMIGIALPAAGQQPVKTVGDAIRGEASATRWCAGCHLPDGNGSVNDAAPTFHWIAGQAQKDPGFIRAFLARPHAPMPPLDLSRQEIEDFVAYFQELAKR